MAGDLKAEDIKVGFVFWWSAERMNRSWSVPTEITEVDDVTKTFRAKTYDNMMQAGMIFSIGTLASHEDIFKHTTPDAIVYFLKKRKLKLDGEILDEERKIADLKREAKQVDQVIDKTLGWETF